MKQKSAPVFINDQDAKVVRLAAEAFGKDIESSTGAKSAAAGVGNSFVIYPEKNLSDNTHFNPYGACEIEKSGREHKGY